MGAGKFAATKVLKKHVIIKVLDGARAGVVGVTSTLELKTGDYKAIHGEFVSEIRTGGLRLEKFGL